MEYTSFETTDSTVAFGVSYAVAKMSFGRRVELMRRIRELASRKEFVEAGDTPDEKMEAALLASEIDRIYLLWGLKEVTGLELDGLRSEEHTCELQSLRHLLCRLLLEKKKSYGSQSSSVSRPPPLMWARW